MYNANLVEKSRIRDRFSDILILSAFIVISSIVSIIVMDLLIFPISIFSVTEKDIFNFLIKYITLISIFSFLVIALVRRIYLLKKNDMKNIDILKHILSKPVMYAVAFIAVIAIIFLLILILYLLFSNNNYLLYKMISR